MAIKLGRLLRWFGLTLGLTLAVLIVSAVALIGTESGRQWMIGKALAAGSSAGYDIRIERLSTPTIGQWHGDALRVAHNGEVLIDATGFELLWSPMALLNQQILIQKASVNTIEIYSSHSDEVEADPAASSYRFKLPSSPLRVTVQNLSINQLTLPSQSNTAKPIPRQWKITAATDLFAPSSPPTLNLNLSTLSAPLTVVQIQSNVDPSNNHVFIEGHLKEEKRGFIASLLQLPKKPLDATFSLFLEQDDAQWVVNLKKFATQLKGHSVKASGTLSLLPSASTVQIHTLILHTDKNRHRLQGAVTPKDLWFKGKLREFPLDIAQPWLKETITGSASGEVDLHWIYSEKDFWPDIIANANVSTTYANQVVKASIKAELKNKIIQLQAAQLNVGKTQISATGTVDILGSTSQIETQIQDISTDLFEQLGITRPQSLGDLFAKTASARLNISGNLKAPTVFLKTDIDGNYKQQAFNLVIDGTADAQKAQFNALVIRADSGEMKAFGLLDWTQNNTALNIEFNALQESLLRLVPNNIPMDFADGLHFEINGKAEITGKLKNPQISTDLTVKGNYKIKKENLPYEITSKGIVQAGNLNQLRINLEKFDLALFGKTVVHAQGKYNPNDMDLILDITRLPILTLAAFGWPDVTGEAEAHLRLTGTFEHPDLSGKAIFKDHLPSNGENSEPIPVDLDLQIATTDGVLELFSRYKVNQQSMGEIIVQAPLSPYLTATGSTIPLQLSISGDMDLAISKWFLDPDLHTLTGSIKTSMTLSGNTSEPLLQGSLSLNNGNYANQISSTQWSDIEVAIVGQGETLLVEKIYARSGSHGAIELSGSVQWQKDKRRQQDAINLVLKAQNAVIIQRRDLYGEANGNIDIKGSFDDIWISGALSVSPLDANIDSAITSTIPSIKVTEIRDLEAEQKSSKAPNIYLDLTITTENQAFIRGRGLEAELSGTIKLKGTAKEPNYTGLFRTRRGRMDLFGKRFKLNQGEVRFSNDTVSLRIPATYSDKEIEISAEIYGTSDEPKLKLSSVPPLPEDEIISRLIFGKSVKDVTPFQAVRLASAINTLRKGGGFDPIDSARSLLGVDTLNIENQETENGPGMSVGIGKYVNEKVYLQLEHTPDAAQPWQATVQIELTPKLRLESGTTETGGAGAEILWKKDY